jgi:mRNA interferase RelE/StbE
MAWQIRFEKKAKQELDKLGASERNRILKFLSERLSPLEDPRSIGDSLKGTLKEFWKYRVGDYRIIALIEDEEVIILVVRIGHRSRVYK